MESKHVHWLLGELPLLVDKGVLPAEAAEGLRRHYAGAKNKSRSLAMTVCAILGAGLVGLGIILLIAHNWPQLGRPLRAALSLAPLLLAQSLAGFVLWRRPTSAAWREGSFVFLMVAVGASIALVGQTYHIHGNPAAFILTWMLLSLGLCYLADSAAVALFYAIGITCWAGYTVSQGGNAYLFWPLAALVAPYGWQLWRTGPERVRTAWFGWTACLCLCVGLGLTLARGAGDGWMIAYASLFALFYLLDTRVTCPDLGLWKRPMHVIGSVGTALCALAFTYRFAWSDLLGRSYAGNSFNLQNDLTATLLLLAALLLMADQWYRQRQAPGLYVLGAPLAAAVALGIFFRLPWEPGLLLFNIYLLCLGVFTLRAGIRSGALKQVNGGLFLISMLVTARFFDLHLSFTVRGLLFILIGISFLFTNLVVKRREATS